MSDDEDDVDDETAMGLQLDQRAEVMDNDSYSSDDSLELAWDEVSTKIFLIKLVILNILLCKMEIDFIPER